MISIEYQTDKTPPCVADTGTSLSCEGLARSISMILYIDYTKGSETDLNITVDLYDDTLDSWYPLQQWDGEQITPVVFTITDSGKYRIPVPTAANEEKMRVNVNLTGSDNADTNVKIVIKPEAINS